MPGNKKPAKKYKPKKVLRNPVAYVLEGFHPMGKAQLLDQLIKCHAALTEMAQGRGTEDQWNEIARALNFSVVMVAREIGHEFLGALMSAQQAHTASARRYKTVGKFGYTGPELGTMSTFMDIHEAQLKACTKIDIEWACMEVIRRIRKGNLLFAAAEPMIDKPS